jgi:SAM-dependent methyltransferase
MTFDAEAVRAFEHAAWQAAATRYGASFAGASRLFVDSLVDAAAVAAGQRVLDVACGPGYAAVAACRRGATACGVDFSTEMLAVARELHRQVEFTEADAEQLPFGDTCFDAVISNFGIHHVPRPALALAEVYRVLMPGGSIAFTIWAEPEHNIAWKLVFDAVRRYGDPAAAQAPPSGGGFRRAADCVAALTAAGFVASETRLERRRWRLPNAAALLTALRQGTARMAALIEAQPPQVQTTILADITRNAEPFRDADAIAFPVAAVVARAVKR